MMQALWWVNRAHRNQSPGHRVLAVIICLILLVIGWIHYAWIIIEHLTGRDILPVPPRPES